MKIQLINQSTVSDTDFKNVVAAMQAFVPMVAKAWNIPDVQVTTDKGDWLVYITEQFRHLGAAGYHTLANGVPVAYISPKASGTSIYGKFWKAVTVKGKQLLPDRYTEGLVTVVAHEIAEMLCDPQIQTVSGVDFKGRKWLIEVCDHVFGVYQSITVNGQLCVIPDVTTPTFYDQHGQAPYDIFNTIQAPFIMSPKGYGYYYDLNNKLTKI